MCSCKCKMSCVASFHGSSCTVSFFFFSDKEMFHQMTTCFNWQQEQFDGQGNLRDSKKKIMDCVTENFLMLKSSKLFLNNFVTQCFYVFLDICGHGLFHYIQCCKCLFPCLTPAIKTKLTNAINQNYFQMNEIRDTLPCKKKISTKKIVYNFPILL